MFKLLQKILFRPFWRIRCTKGHIVKTAIEKKLQDNEKKLLRQQIYVFGTKSKLSKKIDYGRFHNMAFFIIILCLSARR